MNIDLATLFRRDLLRLRQQIEAFSVEADLWKQAPGVTNPAGNLALHIEGNLREYIGRQLGNIPFERNRTEEFTSRGIPLSGLIALIESLQNSIPTILKGLTPEQLEKEYPENVLGKSLSTQQFLLHLYGHLNWHLGQIDIIRRINTGQGALKLAGL